MQPTPSSPEPYAAGQVGLTPRRTAALGAVYLLSGGCSLVYQVVWIHRFSRVFGATAPAAAAVVAVFFAGLAGGSHLFGRASRRGGRPLRLYGLLEAGIGLYALAVPRLIDGVEWIYSRLAAGDGVGEAGLTAARLLLAAAVLLPPTLLMGGTLPLLLRPLAEARSDPGRVAGLLYGLNAAGAGAGSLLAGFVLIRVWGAHATHDAAALLNLGLAAAALTLARGLPALPGAATAGDDPAAAVTGQVADAAPAGARLAVLAAFTLSGLTSLAWEIVWLRHLALVFRDTIELYTGIVSFFIIGLAAGSLLAAPAARRLRRPAACYGVLLAATSLLALVVVHAPDVAYGPLSRMAAGGPAAVLAALAALVLPPTLLMGAAFPLVSRLVAPTPAAAGGDVGSALALNTGAGIAGTLGVGFVLFPVLGLQRGLILLLSLGCIGAALALAAAGGRARRLALLPLLLAPLYAGAVALRPGGPLPGALLAARLEPGARLLTVREGPVSTTWAALDADGDPRLMDGGVVIARADGFAVVQGFVPLLTAPRLPARVAGLAFGGGLSSWPARLFDEVQRMDFVDLSRENVALGLEIFPDNAGLAEDPRVHLHISDAYTFLKYRPQSYDLIFAEPTPPMFSFRNAALFTVEFYRLAAARLADDGRFAQVLPTSNLSPDETATVMRTFATAFPACALWWNNTDLLMIGARAPSRIDAEALAGRLRRPEVSAALARFGRAADLRFAGEVLAGWLLDDAAFREAAATGPIYTDDRPGLQYATGRQVSSAGLDRIMERLAPWRRLRPAIAGFAAAGLDEASLEERRARLVVLSYRSDPERYADLSLQWIERYSPTPAADLETLRQYLEARGHSRRAAEVAARLRALPPAGR